MRRKINIALLVLILLIGLPWYWLLMDNRPGKIEAKPVSIAQLRELAGSIPGTAPSAIEMEQVAGRLLPRNLFAAGDGLKRTHIAVIAWRLPVAGGKPVVIDSGITAVDAAAMGMDGFQAEAQARVDRALSEAGLILITHEHPDHMGALVRKGGLPLASAARLNAGQLPPSVPARDLPWSGRAVPPVTLSGTEPQAVAPGVVVIPAPSHTPGSQMIYVRLADGREALFAGDIASLAANWQELRARSRLVGDWLAPENRREVYAWLKTIRALHAEAPELILLPGHDIDWVLGDPATKALVHPQFRD
ncbi:MAG: MBL fold metallo-hydrolase [Novosphingobium sp.]|jgi:glyoxylase-like metal-dependent hydrolase (beta-lactamase superfamily II)|nr:MBL fold metallo-hydrolase [Novosphingobium sp.]